MLTGSDLLSKIKENGEMSKADLVRSCGYVSTKKDGSEKINFDDFHLAMLEAKGVVIPLESLLGTSDLLPEATLLWQRIEATAREHFRRAAIREIRTPLLEATELFKRGIGEATDVVGKEMYTF